MSNKRFVVIDGDEMLYKAAFASQVTHHYIKFLDGRPEQGPFRTKEEAYEWIEDDTLIEDVEARVIGLSQNIADSRLDSTILEVLGQTDSEAYKVYLTGRGNFRNDVASILPYKGNRTEMIKPVHFARLRERLFSRWDAKEVEGIEADDALSIAGWNNYKTQSNWDVVIATQDKDLNMVPGLRYNPRTKTTNLISPDEARFNLYQQLLTGDPVDNIPGVRGIAKITANKLLATVAGKPHKTIMDMIVMQYQKEADKLSAKNPEVLYGLPKLQEVGQLLWMLQELGQTWDFQTDYYEGLY